MNFTRALFSTLALAASGTASAAILSPNDTTVSQDGQTVISQDVYTPWDILPVVTTSTASCAIIDGASRTVATVYPKASGSSYSANYQIKATDQPGQWRVNCGGTVSDFVVDDVHQTLWLQTGGFDKLVSDYVAAGGPKSTWYKAVPAVGSAPMSWVNSSAWYYELDIVLPAYSYGFAQKVPKRNGTVSAYATTEPWESLYSGGGLSMSSALQRIAVAATTFDHYAANSSLAADTVENNVDEYEKAAIYWANYLVSVPDWSAAVLPGAYRDSAGAFVYCGTGTCYKKDSAGNKVAFSGTKTQATTTLDDLERGQLLIGLAATYDWMHDRLTASQRRAWRDKLIKESIRYRVDQGVPRTWSNYGSSAKGNILTNSHVYYHHAAPAIVAMVLYDEMAATPAARDKWIADADTMFDMALATLKSDGADHQGIGYWEYTFEVMVRYMEAAKTVLGDSSYYNSLWVANTPKFLQYMTYPNGQRVNFGDSEYSDRSTVAGMLARLASQYKSPYIQRLAWKGHNSWSYADGSVRRDVLELLWWDETVTPLSTDNYTARNRCFANKGFTSVRTGWGADAAMLAYRGGGIVGTHDDPDAGSFVIYSEGHLAVTDGTNLTSKRTNAHSTFLVDGKGQHGDGMDMMTFPPQSTSGNDNAKLTTYLDNSSRTPATAATPDVVTMGSDLTQMYRYDSTDVVSAGSTNVEATGKKLYELSRYLVWLGADATLVLDRWNGSAPFRMDWNLSTGKNVDLNADGREDSANPDACPVKKGTRYGYGQYKDAGGVLYDILYKSDVATVCAGTSCTANSTSLYKTNINTYAPVKDTTFVKYACDDTLAVQTANGRVTVKAASTIGGKMDVVPLEASRSNWDKQATPFLSGASISGYHLNRRQTAASGQFLTALMPWSANNPLVTTVTSSAVTGGSQIQTKLSKSNATVLFATPGQTAVKSTLTTLTGVLGVIVEDAAGDPQVAQLVDGTSLVHRGRTMAKAATPVQVGLTFEPTTVYGNVKVKAATAVTIALPDFTASQVTKVEVAGKPVSFTAVTGGITVQVPTSGNLTVYGPGASGTITAVSNCW